MTVVDDRSCNEDQIRTDYCIQPILAIPLAAPDRSDRGFVQLPIERSSCCSGRICAVLRLIVFRECFPDRCHQHRPDNNAIRQPLLLTMCLDCIFDNRGPARMLIEYRGLDFARQAGQTYLNPCWT
jgi:hypothetical protein